MTNLGCQTNLKKKITLLIDKETEWRFLNTWRHSKSTEQRPVCCHMSGNTGIHVPCYGMWMPVICTVNKLVRIDMVRHIALFTS